MANLKDTIVLGNLTVTGSVVASDILVSGTGNEFDTIKVNKIVGQGSGTYTLEIEAFTGSKAMNIHTSCINLTGELYTTYISESGSKKYSIELGGGDSIDLSSAGDINLMTSNEDGTGQIYLNCNQIAIQPVSESGVPLGLVNGGYFTMHSNGSISISDTVGGGCAFYPTGTDISLGTSNNKWNQAYITTVNATTITGGSTSNLSINAGGTVTIGGSTGLTVTKTIAASTTGLNIGSSNTPFNAVYGKNFYASSDIRLKDNISKSNINYYDIINKIQLVNYTWKSDEQHVLHHGLIAQQLKEILPEELYGHLISESDDNERLMSVNDGKLIYFALGALQQQLEINRNLETRLLALENRLRGDK